MNEIKKGFWSNGWVLGIGTTILSVFILRLIDYVADTNILSSIWKGIGSLFSYFNKAIEIKVWLILLITVIVISTFWLLVKYMKWLNNNPTSDGTVQYPAFYYYREDIFDGILYKWDYYKDGFLYNIGTLNEYCPTDNCELYLNKCPVCSTRYYPQKSEDEIRILIKHKVDNNLY